MLTEQTLEKLNLLRLLAVGSHVIPPGEIRGESRGRQGVFPHSFVRWTEQEEGAKREARAEPLRESGLEEF